MATHCNRVQCSRASCTFSGCSPCFARKQTLKDHANPKGFGHRHSEERGQRGRPRQPQPQHPQQYHRAEGCRKMPKFSCWTTDMCAVQNHEISNHSISRRVFGMLWPV